MAYVLGQYNHNRQDAKDWVRVIDNRYEIKNILTKTNDANSLPFTDIGFCLVGNNASFILGQTYYCHCKVKRQSELQKITLKLINYIGDNVGTDEEENYEQYIKIINIQEGIGQWTDIEFIFTPQGNNFNTILFNLHRTTADYAGTIQRKPIVAFLEVSVVYNISDIFPTSEGRLLLKMGIQSRPGLKTIINREEIYIGRTGVYEIKDGEIKINFISFVTPSTNKTNEDLEKIDISDNKNLLFLTEVPTTRTFDSFTIDYIYEQD